MSLKIETFNNLDASTGWRPGNNFGGSSLFKALGHPKVQDAARGLIARLKGFSRIAVYDPEPSPTAAPFDAFFGLAQCPLAGLFVQRVEDVGQTRLGLAARPITELAAVKPDALLIAAFDAQGYAQQIARLVPAGCVVLTLDEIRLPVEWLANPSRYLDPLNWATNFALLRDQAKHNGTAGRHSRVASANYWAGYGAKDAALWLCLFGADGKVLAEWTEDLPGPFGTFAIDSQDVRHRFGLGDFTGSLFIHALRGKGHDVVKYALDIYGDDDRELSCTHDANAWPADLYAGMPAPEADEQLTLWIQNSHPLTIPAGAIGVNIMGSQDIAWFGDEVPPFGTKAIDLNKLLPHAKWPDQIEIQAGRYFVRPRYEVTRRTKDGVSRARIAHANVERTDLKPDANIPKLCATMGKGYIMPLPVLPLAEFHTITLPTPMATCQQDLPIKALLIDGNGTTVAEKFLGRLLRRESVIVDTDAWLAESKAKLPSGYGHVEYLYDFRDGGEADGWRDRCPEHRAPRERVAESECGTRHHHQFGGHRQPCRRGYAEVWDQQEIHGDIEQQRQATLDHEPPLSVRHHHGCAEHVGRNGDHAGNGKDLEQWCGVGV